jgi:hypothetical protein
MQLDLAGLGGVPRISCRQLCTRRKSLHPSVGRPSSPIARPRTSPSARNTAANEPAGAEVCAGKGLARSTDGNQRVVVSAGRRIREAMQHARLRRGRTRSRRMGAWLPEAEQRRRPGRSEAVPAQSNISDRIAPLLLPRNRRQDRPDIGVPACSAIQQSPADRTASTRRLPLRLRERNPRRRTTTLLVWTTSDSHEPATGCPGASGSSRQTRSRLGLEIVITRAGTSPTALPLRDQTSHDVDALDTAQRDRCRTNPVTRRPSVWAARPRSSPQARAQAAACRTARLHTRAATAAVLSLATSRFRGPIGQAPAFPIRTQLSSLVGGAAPFVPEQLSAAPLTQQSVG